MTSSARDMTFDELSRYIERQRQEPQEREHVRVPPRPSGAEPSQVYSLRLPVDRLAALRKLADDRGIPVSGMLREWILERFDAETSRAWAVGALEPSHTAAKGSGFSDMRAVLRMLGEQNEPDEDVHFGYAEDIKRDKSITGARA